MEERGNRAMENAQLINLSRQIALRRQMDVVANNMANINTTGFKAQDILMEEWVSPVARDQDFAGHDQRLSFTEDWATMTDMAPGTMAQTGSALDVGLQGNGFFVVDTPAGERWTRSGAFQIDANGTLVDLSGNPVQGEGGPITFDPTETDITIADDGTVMTEAGSKGKLRIVEFDDPRMLTREGDNLYSGGAPQANAETRAVQGFIEKSNVSGVTEMAEMIRVNRAYQTLASIMDREDQLRSTAIRRLGDLSA
jgi:flagellar basal-body rod protein FlgF